MSLVEVFGGIFSEFFTFIRFSSIWSAAPSPAHIFSLAERIALESVTEEENDNDMEGGGSVCVWEKDSQVVLFLNHCESSWGGGEYEEGREMELEIISCNLPVHLPTALYWHYIAVFRHKVTFSCYWRAVFTTNNFVLAMVFCFVFFGVAISQLIFLSIIFNTAHKHLIPLCYSSFSLCPKLKSFFLPTVSFVFKISVWD